MRFGRWAVLRPRALVRARQRGFLVLAAVIAAASCNRGAQSTPGVYVVRPGPVNVYRGLDSSANGRAVLSPSQFRFNPDLSTFNTTAATNKGCTLQLTILATNAVQGLAGYTGDSTPPPAGHFSIYLPGGVTDSAGRVAVSTYARANTDRINPARCRPAAVDMGVSVGRPAPVDVYRGLDTANSGRATLSPSQFRFNPEMSTFNTTAATQRGCTLRLTILANDTVQGLPGYRGDSTPPPGHFSIYLPNGVVDTTGRRVMSEYARANTDRLNPARCRPAAGGSADVDLVTVSVYRGLDAKPNGKAMLSPSQFRFNSDMSTFDAQPANKPCAYVYRINTGDSTVQELPGYKGWATPPVGHYSIWHPSSLTDQQAAVAVSDSAKAHMGGISPQACQ